MKIYAIHNNTGSKHYRLIPQLREMQKRGHKVIVKPHDDLAIRQHIDWCDKVIFQMVFSYEWIKYAKEKGKRVVFECDDLVHTVPKTHYSYPETKGWKNRIKWWYRIWRVIRLCDGFISTNKGLDRLYGRFARKSLVFPNYCDLAHWVRPYKPNLTNRIRILWAGSTSHTGDLEMIKPVIKKILEKYKEKVQFIYIGHGGIKSKDKQAQFIYGKDLFEGLPDNRESMLSVPSVVWPHILASLGADIAIAPLEKNYFNGFKSQCKYLEYSINRIPAVYSEWFYTNVRHQYNGLTANTESDWIRCLEYLIENPKQRKEIGENAYQDVLKNHDIRLYIDNWINFIDKV